VSELSVNCVDESNSRSHIVEVDAELSASATPLIEDVPQGADFACACRRLTPALLVIALIDMFDSNIDREVGIDTLSALFTRQVVARHYRWRPLTDPPRYLATPALER
jgi:hypothetical protein